MCVSNGLETEGVFINRDTICDMGGAAELANYGEYSGAPSEQQTYDYAKTILSLMCKQVHPQGELVSVTNVAHLRQVI